MNFSLADGMVFDFDGLLADANGHTVKINCRVWPPLVSGEEARVDFGIPHAQMPVANIQNPCNVSGRLGSMTIWFDDVWYRYLPTNRQSHTGLSPIALTHIGKLRLTISSKSSSGIVESESLRRIKFHLTKNAFLSEGNWLSTLSRTPNSQSDELYTVDIPQLGKVRFVREWVFARTDIPETAIVKSGFCAVIELSDATFQTIDECLTRLEDVLMVMSIFCRQRITVLGWEAEYDDRREQVWHDPLEPLSTKYVPYEPDNYLVERHSFASLLKEASASFFILDLKTKKVFEHISRGVVPFIEMRTSEHFLAMFHALEECRVFAPENGIGNSREANNALIEILEEAKPKDNSDIADRIDGFIKMVSRPTLQQQLDWVLVNKWDVDCEDLWPVCGSDKFPGLKQIRDKLAHRGPQGIQTQSLAVATWHLSILLERVLLSLLNISADKTLAAKERLIRREEWYRRSCWLEQQKHAIKTSSR